MHVIQVKGFTLIEVLVALVVLSIGLIGIAALHVEGVQWGQSALLRTRAVSLAADMADRIRANPGGADIYANTPLGGAGPQPNPKCADDPDGQAPGDCTPAEMAVYDIWSWREAVDAASATGLPGGVSSIARDDTTTPDTFLVSLLWTEKGQLQRYTITVQP